MALNMATWLLNERLMPNMHDDCYHVVEQLTDGKEFFCCIVLSSVDQDSAIQASNRFNADNRKTIVLLRQRRTLLWKGSVIKEKDLGGIYSNLWPVRAYTE